MRVLLVEDDHVIGSAVRDQIAAQGHGVDWAMRLDEAGAFLDVAQYDLMLLDMALPDGRGLDFLTQIRRDQNDVPVIIVTAQDQITSRIDGLNAGADDYLVKPFDLKELTARIAAVARRYNAQPTPWRGFGEIQIDPASRTVTSAGSPVDVTAREWAVLERLTRTPNATVAKPDIEDALYEFGAEVESNTVEVYVSRLRKKLGRDFIRTIRGLGYQVPAEMEN